MQHHIQHNFLSNDAAADLLAYAITHEQRFTPSPLHYAGERTINAAVRSSLRLAEFEPQAAAFQAVVMAHVPQFAAWLGMQAPAVRKVELEMVAHGDGAFFARHLDNASDAATRSHRVLTGAYYFHAMPKAFAGGLLRLFPPEAAPIDIEPTHNSFVVFPPSIAHEVTPVVCPSPRFLASRFSINVWLSSAEPQLRPIASPG